MATGAGVDLSAAPPPGLKRARELAKEMIAKLNVPMERLVLGGFSQGAMLATEVALSAETPPAGLAILSGSLVNAPAWERLAVELSQKRPGFSFFQSHGASDPVLSLGMAERLERLLKQAGCSGQLLRFHGGHEIPPEVVIQLGAYLRRVLGNAC
jgi:phospholipase/carboxylesterase